MTKNELIKYLRIRMYENINSRDETDPCREPEEYGSFNGYYEAFQEVIEILTRNDITKYPR